MVRKILAAIRKQWFNVIINKDMNKWFGLSINFKWPHEGICLGLAIDFFDEEEDSPWCSILVRFLFLTISYDFGYGEDNKEQYNNQG